MDDYIKPIVQICKKIFKDFLHLDVDDEQPYSFEKEISGDWDISAVMGFSGEARGTIVMSMKKNDACIITGILTGQTPADINADVCDAMGEITNIISGNAKMKVESQVRLEISLPTVVYGQEHSVRWPDEGEQMEILFTCVPFRLPNGSKFLVSLAFGPQH